MSTTNEVSVEEMRARLQHIKDHMPKTYELIVKKAELEGDGVYRAVRRGCLGEPNRFWAMEAGHFAGTAFNMRSVEQEVAWQMVNFGDTWAIAFDPELDGGKRPTTAGGGGGGNGAH